MAALCSALMPAARAEAEGCLDALAVEGDPELVDAARRELEDGRLAAVDADGCEGVEIRVARDGERVRVRLARGDQVIERSAMGLAPAMSWAESWLLPVAPVAAVPVVVEVPSLPVAEPVVAARAAEPERGVPLQLAVRAGVDMDSVAPAWPAVEAVFAVGIYPRVSIAIAAAGAWAPEQDATRRHALRMSARALYHPGGRRALALGGGLGLVSAAASREQDGMVVHDELAGPFVEALASYDLRVSKRSSVSFAAVLRGVIPDEIGGGPDPDEMYEPATVAPFAATLQVGFAWDLAR